MPAPDIDPHAVLLTSEVFRCLDAQSVREIAAVGRVERYDKRTLLLGQGQMPDTFRYIVEGRVDLMMSTKDGKNSTLPLFAGGWATWLSCFSQRRIDHEMWTSKPATLVAFPRALVRSLVSRNADAMFKVIENIGETTRFLIIWTLGGTLHSAEKRLAYLLVQAMQLQASSGSQSSQTMMTQEQLGHLGIGSRQRVGRLLHGLRERGLITMNYGVVAVPDAAKLQAFIFG